MFSRMGEYSGNGHGTVGCTKSNQAHWIDCFRIIDTVFTKVMQIQRLHMDLMWYFEEFSDTGNRRDLAEKQRKECEHLEEEMRSLKKTMLEEVLCCETDGPNVVTQPKASEENISLFPNVVSLTLKCDGWDEVKHESDAEYPDKTKDNADFALNVQLRNIRESDQSSSCITADAPSAESKEGYVELSWSSECAEETRMNERAPNNKENCWETSELPKKTANQTERCEHSTSGEKLLVILPKLSDSLVRDSILTEKQIQRNTVPLLEEIACNSTEIPESVCKTEVCAESGTSIYPQKPTVHEQMPPIPIPSETICCDTNGHPSATESPLIYHLRMYGDEKPFKCEICAKKFLRRSDLNRHLRMHTGEKPYECNVCAKRLTEKSKLIRHLRIHSGEKPYECEVCAKKFNEITALKNHSRMHKEERPFECGVCARKFLKEPTLVRHLRIHNGEKPFECEVCARKFRDSSQLVSHLRIHNGEKPYECEICAKKFNHRKSLMYHLRMHNGEKPYDCEVCAKKFRGKSELIRHLTKAKSHLNVKSAQENFAAQ